MIKNINPKPREINNTNKRAKNIMIERMVLLINQKIETGNKSPLNKNNTKKKMDKKMIMIIQKKEKMKEQIIKR